MGDGGKLHIVVLPWLAMGHLIPFLELSKCLAQKGHRVSFVSTPRNIQRLPRIPPEISSSLINLVELPLPEVDGLLENAEATIDLPPDKVHYLKKAFDGLKDSVLGLLEDLVPDWIIYDFASHWLPPLARKLGIPCGFFSLFNAASISFFGPTSALMSGAQSNSDSFVVGEDFTIVPKWMNFPTYNVGLRIYEATRITNSMKENVAEVSDPQRYALAVEGSDVIFIRSGVEFEQFWLELVEKEILHKPVIPVGFLPPSVEEDNSSEWVAIETWLKKQGPASVIYVALGTEATLTQEEVNELALGLELSNLPFFWVLRKPSSSSENDSYVLPAGFEDRIKGRGIICKGWAPQVKILAHESVGGFLTHCGWNSIIESLSVGCALVLLPLIAEQGVNARVLHGEKIGLEIQRDKQEGSFTRDSVAATLRMVMVDEYGEMFRKKTMEMRDIFGNKELSDQYIDMFVLYLQHYEKH